MVIIDEKMPNTWFDKLTMTGHPEPYDSIRPELYDSVRPDTFYSFRPELVEGRTSLTTDLSKGVVTYAQTITPSCIA